MYVPRTTALRRTPPPGRLLGAAAAALVPISVWLAATLPCRHASRHWAIAWTGFDVCLAAALGLAALALHRRAAWFDRAAIAAATLLAVDAWFDTVTSTGTSERVFAGGEAALVELPLAAFCLFLATTSMPNSVDRRPVVAVDTNHGQTPGPGIREFGVQSFELSPSGALVDNRG
jgi:hypothetical protein